MRKKLSLQVAAFTFARVVIDTLFRMVYPFATVFGNGLGIGYAEVVRALSWRFVPGMFGPLFASLSDNRGRRTGMLFGVMVLFLGLVVVVVWPTFTGFIVMLVLTATGKYIFDPAMRAYLGDHVPYGRRGSFIAITEMGWSWSFLFGVPVVGFFISRWGWLSPFPLLLALSLVLGLVIFKLIPQDSPTNNVSMSYYKRFKAVFSYPTATVTLVVSLLSTLANEIVTLVFGVWLENSFGLQIMALGGAAAVIGFAELGGESLVVVITDKLGKVQAVTYGLIGSTLMSFLLPVLGKSVTGALVGLFLFYLCFEFTFVSLMPLMTEVLPGARATLMALGVTSYSVGRWVATMITPQLFAIGFAAAAGVAGAINLLSWLALKWVKMDVDE
ncbi:MAG: MFS transporter [Anaerolineales bacterium]|jgi:predicted MFS family arabinose efflux permease